MTFQIQNWARSSVSANEPLVTLGSGVQVGSFRTYNYQAPGVAGVSGDTQTTIATASYFDAVNYDLQTGDIIFAYSVRDATMQTYFCTNTDGVITVTSFNFGAGAIGTANIIDGAVTVAKMANLAATTLLGNPTGGALAPSAITLGNGLEFSGTTLRVPLATTRYVTGTITAAQFNGMNATPFLVIAAPGVGLMNRVHDFMLTIDYGGTQFAGGGAVGLQYGNTAALAGPGASATIPAAGFTGAVADSVLGAAGSLLVTTSALTGNVAIYLSNLTAAFTTGTSTLSYYISYSTYPSL